MNIPLLTGLEFTSIPDPTTPTSVQLALRTRSRNLQIGLNGQFINCSPEVESDVPLTSGILQSASGGGGGSGFPTVLLVYDDLAKSAAETNVVFFTAPATGYYRITGFCLITSTGLSKVTSKVALTPTASINLYQLTSIDMLATGQNAGRCEFLMTLGDTLQYSTTLSGAVGSGVWDHHFIVERLS